MIQPAISRLLSLFILLSVLVAVTGAPSHAQDATEPAAEAPAEPEAGAPAEAPPALAAHLSDPAIPVEELALRLIPLTSDDLAALSEKWLALAKAKTEEVVEQQVLIANAEGNVEDDAREQLSQLNEERSALFEKYGIVVDSWEKKGGDPAAVAIYRAYRNSVIVEETRSSDWKTLVDRAMKWAASPDGGIRLGTRIAVIAGSLIGLFLVARIIRRVARGWIARIPNLSKLLQAFLLMLIYWLVIAFGLMIVLSMLGIDITPVFALIGGASFILAFAMQDTLGNLAAGLMIMINRPFDEGDYVDIGGVGGTVKAVSIVSTTVTTPDNQVIVVPNSKVWGNVITNVTASDTRRVDLVFGIGYDDSIEEAQRVLEETVHAHPLVLADPEPVIRVNELADSSVNFICRPWVKSEDYWTVYWDLMRQVKQAFDAAGISIPFPQTEMHLRLPKDAPAPAVLTGAASDTGEGRPAGAPDYATGDEGYGEKDDGDR